MQDALERMIPAALVLAICGLLVVSAWTNAPVRFPLDDAYITLANAQMLLDGGVDSFGNRGPTGATSLIHLLALTGLGTIVPLPVANLLLSSLATLAYALGLWQLARGLGAGVTLAAGIVLTGLTAGMAWYHLQNGLETGIAMAAVTWVLVLLMRPASSRTENMLAVLIGVLPFIRPELAVLAGLAALSLVLRLRAAPHRVAFAALTALLTAGTLSLVAWTVIGGVVPATAGAKSAFFAEAALPLTDRLSFALQILVLNPIAPFLVGIMLVPLLPGGWAMVAFAAVFVFAAVMSLPGGLAHNDFRYLYTFLPLALGGWLALVGRHGLVGRMSTAILMGLTIYSLASFPFQGWPKWHTALSATDDQERLALWAEANLSPDARVLIHDAGYFAWRTNFALVDAVGLKTPEVVAFHRHFTLPSAGGRRSDALNAIAQTNGVSHAIILDRPFWRDLEHDLNSHGRILEPLRPAEPGLLYQIFALTPPPE